MPRHTAITAFLVLAWGCSAGDPGEAPKVEVLPITDGDSARAEIGKTVQFTGRAANAKLSAVVHSSDLLLYCIERTEWPQALLGKRIVVTGVLERTDKGQARNDEIGRIHAGTDGEIYVLRSVVYEVH